MKSIVLLLGLLVVTVLAWSLSGAFRAVELPSYAEVRERYRSSDLVLRDRRGQAVQQIRVDYDLRSLPWKSLEDCPFDLQQAVIRAEDHRFHRHSGVDWLAAAAAARSWLSGGEVRGASTITMQLVAMLTSELPSTGRRKSLLQKWLQTRAAMHLEQNWKKEQILEAYLNLVWFRGELRGIASAARGLYGKEPHGLSLAECLVLATLIRAPGAASSTIRTRVELLADRLERILDVSELDKALEPLSAGYRIERRVDLAPQAARRLLARLPGGSRENSISSTLDLRLQRAALKRMQRYLGTLRKRHVTDAALLVVENASGEVLVYLGNGGRGFSSAHHVDGVQALRQAGSTLKPFLYGQAFEDRLLTPASLLSDSRTEISVTGGSYLPSNYDNRYRGPVTCRVALASSLNIPAVRTIQLLGIDRFLETLADLGFRSLRSADFYGPSLALGSADISLWDLVQGYLCLASGGLRKPLRLSPSGVGKESERRVFSQGTAFLLQRILSDRESRSSTFSLDSPLATRYWSAVKTGTSKDMRDNWCVGFTESYTVGVWVGNFDGSSMWNVSGITGAAPLWREMIDLLHSGIGSGAPGPPPGVTRREVFFEPEGGSRSEWFLEGSEPSSIRSIEGRTPARIRYPLEGTVIAVDPDIPAKHQWVFFEGESVRPEFSWVLNGEPMGQGGATLRWRPVTGLHELELRNGNWDLLDRVQFSVRGPEPLSRADSSPALVTHDRP